MRLRKCKSLLCRRDLHLNVPLRYSTSQPPGGEILAGVWTEQEIIVSTPVIIKGYHLKACTWRYRHGITRNISSQYVISNVKIRDSCQSVLTCSRQIIVLELAGYETNQLFLLSFIHAYRVLKHRSGGWNSTGSDSRHADLDRSTGNHTRRAANNGCGPGADHVRRFAITHSCADQSSASTHRACCPTTANCHSGHCPHVDPWAQPDAGE